MNSIKISFCIPTFNRDISVNKLVCEILKCSRRDIEVIVQDNNSTDLTLNYLSQIDDKRLKIYSNQKNIGSIANILSVITKGTGEYIFFLLDKDFINYNKISSLLDFLDQHFEVAAGYCNQDRFKKFSIYDKGLLAVKNIGYLGHHPSGNFFKRDAFKVKNCSEKYTANLCEGFPFEFIFSDIAQDNYVAVFHEDLIITESETNAALIKSFTYNNNPNAYFYPKSRIRMSIKFLIHANDLKIKQKEKIDIFLDIFLRGIYAASLGYRKSMNDVYFCSHHNIKIRQVNFINVALNAFIFYAIFSKKLIILIKFSDFLFFNNLLIARLVEKLFIEAFNFFKKVFIRY